jgi:hypothetical protein
MYTTNTTQKLFLSCLSLGCSNRQTDRQSERETDRQNDRWGGKDEALADPPSYPFESARCPGQDDIDRPRFQRPFLDSFRMSKTMGSIFPMRSGRKWGLGENESCGTCALTCAGTVTHSVRLRSGYRSCQKCVEKKKSVAGQFAVKPTSSIGQKHLAGLKN